jgi:GNAT superfamily N-acetyltransferase
MKTLGERMINEIPMTAQESNALFISVWRLFAESFHNADITTRDGLVISWPDVPLPVYNNIFFTGNLHDPAILAARVSEAALFARTKRQPGFITVCHDLLSGRARTEIDAILARERYVPAMPLTGMAGDLLPLPAPGHSALHIERAEDNGLVLTDINCIAYGFPLETGRASLPQASLWQDAFPYVAFEEDRAVATATTFVHRDCLYLALVATVPDARGKGYAQTIVRHSLQRAHEATGFTRTLLHATNAGYPVYGRLGYRAAAQFTCYLPR